MFKYFLRPKTQTNNTWYNEHTALEQKAYKKEITVELCLDARLIIEVKKSKKVDSIHHNVAFSLWKHFLIYPTDFFSWLQVSQTYGFIQPQQGQYSRGVLHHRPTTRMSLTSWLLIHLLFLFFLIQVENGFFEKMFECHVSLNPDLYHHNDCIWLLCWQTIHSDHITGTLITTTNYYF